MSLEDMTDLVTIYDGLLMMEDAIELLTGVKLSGAYYDGAQGRLTHIFSIIDRNSKFYAPDEDYDSVKDEQGRGLDDILDLDLPAEERAKLLMPE